MSAPSSQKLPKKSLLICASNAEIVAVLHPAQWQNAIFLWFAERKITNESTRTARALPSHIRVKIIARPPPSTLMRGAASRMEDEASPS
jgi:hypothetical protein